jgi:MFS family permease
MSTELHDRSVAELTKELSRDVSELVRKELMLAKAETTQKARRLGVGLGLIAAGAVCGLVVLGALTAAAIMALDIAVADWAAALIVAAIVGVITAVLVLSGLKSVRRATPPTPTDTVDSVKEDVAWVKTRAKSGTT